MSRARKLGLMGTAAVVVALTVGCGEGGSTSGGDAGVDVAELSPVVDNPYVAFAAVRRAEYEGEEIDPDTGEVVEIRVVASPSTATATVAGTEVAIVEVRDFEDGELIERTEDYYAQASDGTVYYMGEAVDDIEGGEVVGHEGQWQAGQDGARAGVFMPAEPMVGDEFEQERAPGVAEDRSRLVRTGVTVRVPAGTFENCIETEDVDPLSDVTKPEHKFYCPGVGLVRERFPAGGTLDLVSYEKARFSRVPDTRPKPADRLGSIDGGAHSPR